MTPDAQCLPDTRSDIAILKDDFFKKTFPKMDV